MTLRGRIADWISGGALTRATDLTLKSAVGWGKSEMRLCDLEESLRRIADMETPSANATVRRMAAEARKGLRE